jgi:hypothetical protein
LRAARFFARLRITLASCSIGAHSAQNLTPVGLRVATPQRLHGFGGRSAHRTGLGSALHGSHSLSPRPRPRSRGPPHREHFGAFAAAHEAQRRVPLPQPISRSAPHREHGFGAAEGARRRRVPVLVAADDRAAPARVADEQPLAALEPVTGTVLDVDVASSVVSG